MSYCQEMSSLQKHSFLAMLLSYIKIKLQFQLQNKLGLSLDAIILLQTLPHVSFGTTVSARRLISNLMKAETFLYVKASGWQKTATTKEVVPLRRKSSQKKNNNLKLLHVSLQTTVLNA